MLAVTAAGLLSSGDFEESAAWWKPQCATEASRVTTGSAGGPDKPRNGQFMYRFKGQGGKCSTMQQTLRLPERGVTYHIQVTRLVVQIPEVIQKVLYTMLQLFCCSVAVCAQRMHSSRILLWLRRARHFAHEQSCAASVHYSSVAASKLFRQHCCDTTPSLPLMHTLHLCVCYCVYTHRRGFGCQSAHVHRRKAHCHVLTYAMQLMTLLMG
jgi:hypothetical protein